MSAVCILLAARCCASAAPARWLAKLGSSAWDGGRPLDINGRAARPGAHRLGELRAAWGAQTVDPMRASFMNQVNRPYVNEEENGLPSEDGAERRGGVIRLAVLGLPGDAPPFCLRLAPGVARRGRVTQDGACAKQSATSAQTPLLSLRPRGRPGVSPGDYESPSTVRRYGPPPQPQKVIYSCWLLATAIGALIKTNASPRSRARMAARRGRSALLVMARGGGEVRWRKRWGGTAAGGERGRDCDAEHCWG